LPDGILHSRGGAKPSAAKADRGARAVANVAAFGEKLESLRQRYHIPGLSAGIVEEGKLAWNKGFGYADLERKIVPDENTVYQIASVTKTFGSIIVMQLVQAGFSKSFYPVWAQQSVS
jgi:CubicO group peptidase (beta-lactamase class C family)